MAIESNINHHGHNGRHMASTADVDFFWCLTCEHGYQRTRANYRNPNQAFDDYVEASALHDTQTARLALREISGAQTIAAA